MKAQLMHPDACVPTRATNGSAAFDLYACVDERIYRAQGPVKLRTGVAVRIPESHVGLIVGRSGMTMDGLNVLTGVIDSDFTGELGVMAKTRWRDGHSLAAGQRIAQLLIVPIATPDIEVVDELPATERGSNGFGSTGA